MQSQLSEFPRTLHLELRHHNAAFLWGPIEAAKTTLLRRQFATARYIDLLQSDLKTSLLLRPSLLREEVAANPYDLVVVDEVQKVPAQAHSLIGWPVSPNADNRLLSIRASRENP